MNSRWSLYRGKPDANEWLHGEDFLCVSQQPFNQLLISIGEKLGTKNRKVIAAALMLRYGYSATFSIASTSIFKQVPNINLSNISIKFSQGKLFEKLAIHQDLFDQTKGKKQPDTSICMPALAKQLKAQVSPIVDALNLWSRSSKKNLWGIIASTWSTQIINICKEAQQQENSQLYLDYFFSSDDILDRVKPSFFEISHQNQTKTCHQRTSCCLNFKVSETKTNCTSCPAISYLESRERHLIQFKKQLAR